MSLLVLRALRLRYGATRQADGLDLSFPDVDVPFGGHLLLRGPSGSGKSSLLALMAGLLTPTSGQVLMNGADLGVLRPSQRDAWRGAQLGFMPQRLHLSESLSVRDNLSLPYVADGLRPDLARIESLLAELGIAGVLDRRPHALSQGQAQRVALARALLRSPRFVLADEPTANLDDDACAATLALLRHAADMHGACLVIASHDARIERAWGDWHALRRLHLQPQGRESAPSGRPAGGAGDCAGDCAGDGAGDGESRAGESDARAAVARADGTDRSTSNGVAR